jgi:hypothetical protein
VRVGPVHRVPEKGHEPSVGDCLRHPLGNERIEEVGGVASPLRVFRSSMYFLCGKYRPYHERPSEKLLLKRRNSFTAAGSTRGWLIRSLYKRLVPPSCAPMITKSGSVTSPHLSNTWTADIATRASSACFFVASSSFFKRKISNLF